jgi:hypothetical protein
MAVNPKVSVVGARETLAALKKLDPELRKQTVREIKSAGRPVLATARSLVPSQAMSGWGAGNWGARGWDDPARTLKVRFGGRAAKKRQQWRLLSLKQEGAAGAIFDLAGKQGGNGTPQSRQFLANVDRFGGPSRTVWPAVEKNKDAAEATIVAALRKAESTINKTTKG